MESDLFQADEVASINIERGALISVQVKGDFEYDVIAGVNSDKAGRSVSGQSGQSTLDGQAAEEPAIRPFSLRDIDLQIPQGALYRPTWDVRLIMQDLWFASWAESGVGKPACFAV